MGWGGVRYVRLGFVSPSLGSLLPGEENQRAVDQGMLMWLEWQMRQRRPESGLARGLEWDSVRVVLNDLASGGE